MNLIGPENYGVWSKSMCIALLVKNKLGFVDDTYARSLFKRSYFNAMGRCDVVVLSWIIAVVAPELMTSSVYDSSSKSI